MSTQFVDAEKIEIVSIKTLEGSITFEESQGIDDISGHGFEFELTSGFDLDGKIVGIKLKVDIVAYNSKGTSLPRKGSFTHEIVFRVENLDDFAKSEEGKLSAILGSTLVGMAYSTIRGMIFMRTQTTSLGAVILPVVAPLKLMGIEKVPEKKA